MFIATLKKLYLIYFEGKGLTPFTKPFHILKIWVLTLFSENQLNSTPRDEQYVISLTTFPARIKDVSICLTSLLRQQYKADKVILWLALEQFPNKERDLPRRLKRLTKLGLEIKWYHDIRSYKKLIPAIKLFPESVIITADDDIIYPKTWLSLLVASYQTNKKAVHCHRAHRIRLNSDLQPQLYDNWDPAIPSTKGHSSLLHFPTGCGGILYPKNFYYSDLFDEALFKKLAPDADDFWFWAMAVLNDCTAIVCQHNIEEIAYVNLFQEYGLGKAYTLSQSNVYGRKNDVIFSNLLAYYPKLKNLLSSNRPSPVPNPALSSGNDRV